METAFDFNAVVAILLRVAVFLALLVIFALAHRELFENLISQPIIEPLAKRYKLAEFVKNFQAVLVLAAAVVLSLVSKIDLLSILNDPAIIPPGVLDPNTQTIITAILATAYAYRSHSIIKGTKG